jgi:predicted DsbA family dithiol-disulfide isomerase
MEPLRVDVWSDIACPWCYIGKRRLEGALARFPHRDRVSVVWRAFELDPSAPLERDPGVSYVARISKKYGASASEAEAMLARVVEAGRGEGLDLRFDRARSGNTFDAHRILHLAGERGMQDALKERYLRAYLTEGELIGDHETLVRLGAEVGLPPEEIRAALASEDTAAAVRVDEREAHELGIRGVPFFLIGRYAVSGAQPSDVLLRALTLAWGERPPEPVVIGEGAVCGPEGCEV